MQWLEQTGHVLKKTQTLTRKRQHTAALSPFFSAKTTSNPTEMRVIPVSKDQTGDPPLSEQVSFLCISPSFAEA